jgi:hypothetical protein
MALINKQWDEPSEIGMVIQCDGIVTNLEFHDQGQYLAITSNQSAIHFVDCLSGIEKKKYLLRKMAMVNFNSAITKCVY